MNYFYIACIALIVCFILQNIVKKAADALCLSHSDKRIPCTGGLAFSLTFFICYILYTLAAGFVFDRYLLWIILFSFFLVVIESIDDRKNLSLKSRVIIQTVFIALFLLHAKRIEIYFLPSWVNYLLSFLWIMGITNAFNHLDIVDGLCGGVSFVVCIVFLMIAIIKGYSISVVLFLILATALFVFLLLNFPPAKIYMGNAGSHFLGFLFATLSMYGDYATLENTYVLTLPLLILAFPIIDTLFLIVSRSRKGISPLKKSDDHIALRLLASGQNIETTLLIIYFVSLLWGLSGVLMLSQFKSLFSATIICASVLTVFIILKAHRAHQKPLS